MAVESTLPMTLLAIMKGNTGIRKDMHSVVYIESTIAARLYIIVDLSASPSSSSGPLSTQ